VGFGEGRGFLCGGWVGNFTSPTIVHVRRRKGRRERGKGEGRREEGGGRREKGEGEGRREKGEGRREKGEGENREQKTKGEERREKGE
jgi:hypothetical protein